MVVKGPVYVQKGYTQAKGSVEANRPTEESGSPGYSCFLGVSQ